ncbi:MAG: pyrrolysine--tRNA(Pyl) ligase large subunit [Dethiosulfatibacter sp.]|nr:pyrrolysine--tRNA(Pyl) ligase large subunit [Dethiosulfatibacter sp.]
MPEKMTETQITRLVELNVDKDDLNRYFDTTTERDAFYRKKEKYYADINRQGIVNCLNDKHEVTLVTVQNQLSEWLTKNKQFTQVVTPAFITKEMLSKMTITPEHPLFNQVFWLDAKKCLRPMLAPNLYELMRDLKRAVKHPVKIFEVGSCFRKESQGAEHLNEFTMLNLVQFGGIDEGTQMDILRQMASEAMEFLRIKDYELIMESSEVYNETLDIVVDGIEVASCSFGPHSLDERWGVFDAWIGMGFGIERLAMVMNGYNNIKRVGRSLTYFDGARLTV